MLFVGLSRITTNADQREDVRAIAAKSKHTVLDVETRRFRAAFIKKVLVEQHGNMTKTAHALRMWRSQLYHIITHDKELTRIWRSGRKRELQRRRRKKAT